MSATLLKLPIIESPRLKAVAGWSDPAEWHVFETEVGWGLYVADGSRVFAIDEQVALEFAQAQRNEVNAYELLSRFEIGALSAIDDQPVRQPPLRSLSLAVSQKCNLACSYCYADGGDFGGTPANMPLEVALSALDRLFENASTGETVHVAFLGGEPLINREVIRKTTASAVDRASRAGIEVGFSITTNGSLLTKADAEFFEGHRFAVTVSLDGVGSNNDSLRPFKSGGGSYRHVIERVMPLLELQQSMQVSARVTVTPANLELPRTLDEFIRLGFHSVGFSPMLSSPSGSGELSEQELNVMLEQMLACGHAFEQAVVAGERFPFSNMVTAMKEIHGGTHRPYPCGAGSGYMGVSASGGLFACHRFVEDPLGSMGSIEQGVDRAAQAEWLESRHVHRQEPCNQCWARYLCGGGCHHEVLKRGRPACHYIRGWLHYCLQAYQRLVTAVPHYFEPMALNDRE